MQPVGLLILLVILVVSTLVALDYSPPYTELIHMPKEY